MNNEPWFNLDSESARLYQKVKDAEQPASNNAYPELADNYFGEDHTQPSENDFSSDDQKIRFGNNRKKVKGFEAKARRKMAKKSKQRNRK